MKHTNHADNFFEKFENDYENKIKSGPYIGTHAIFSWLVEAVTSCNILDDKFYSDHISLLYGESLKRMRSSSILASKGYFSDSLALIRSIFELMKAINAIQSGLIDSESYVAGFLNTEEKLSENDIKKRYLNHNKEMDRLCNEFDNKDIPDDLKFDLRIFKDHMHQSVHKSQFNLYWNLIDFHKKGKSDPFKLTEPIELYELSFNYFAFTMLMYMRNLLNSGFVRRELDVDLFKERIAQLEYSYSNMESSLHKSLIKYIQLKFRYK